MRAGNGVISGCIGLLRDDCRTDISKTAGEAEAYHRAEIATFRESDANMVAAFAIPCMGDGIGIALAAEFDEMPVVLPAKKIWKFLSLPSKLNHLAVNSLYRSGPRLLECLLLRSKTDHRER